MGETARPQRSLRWRSRWCWPRRCVYTGGAGGRRPRPRNSDGRDDRPEAAGWRGLARLARASTHRPRARRTSRRASCTPQAPPSQARSSAPHTSRSQAPQTSQARQRGRKRTRAPTSATSPSAARHQPSRRPLPRHQLSRALPDRRRSANAGSRANACIARFRSREPDPAARSADGKPQLRAHRARRATSDRPERERLGLPGRAVHVRVVR